MTIELELHLAEKDRRRRRFETRQGAVHKRRNGKNRKAEAEQSNTKRGHAWRRDI